MRFDVRTETLANGASGAGVEAEAAEHGTQGLSGPQGYVDHPGGRLHHPDAILGALSKLNCGNYSDHKAKR